MSFFHYFEMNSFFFLLLFSTEKKRAHNWNLLELIFFVCVSNKSSRLLVYVRVCTEMLYQERICEKTNRKKKKIETYTKKCDFPNGKVCRTVCNKLYLMPILVLPKGQKNWFTGKKPISTLFLFKAEQSNIICSQNIKRITKSHRWKMFRHSHAARAHTHWWSVSWMLRRRQRRSMIHCG